MRRKLARLVMLVACAATALALLAGPASAQKLIGCNSKLNWPCPGPAL